MIELGNTKWEVGRRRRGNRRVAPAAYRDAAELFARQHGVHGDVEWVPDPANFWQVKFTLKSNDPRERGTEKHETVQLHRYVRDPYGKGVSTKDQQRLRRHPRSNKILPGYISYELDEIGVEGMIQILERGSLLSGRGRFTSSEHAVDVSRKKHNAASDRRRTSLMQQAGYKARDLRRSILKIPFMRVGIDLKKEKEA